MSTSKLKRRAYPVGAVLLGAVVAFLTVWDLSDGSVGVPFRVALILSGPLTALIVLSWLQWNLPAITMAFRAGMVVAGRDGVVPAPRSPHVLPRP